ncbi:sulfatase-like hydrolase/transferase [Inquilinus limosus]|uniref:sulfatase-like hydrolase/transferase n=1 Tax=Inquilinus limosus TaxID=171674 RepID=UPI003F15C3DB
MTPTDTALPRFRLAPLLGGLRVAAALVWLTLLLGMPSDPNSWQTYSLISVPVELAILTLLLALAAPLRRSQAVAAGLGGLGLLFVLLKLADLATQLSFGRPVNLYVDRLLLVNGMHLASGVIGAFGLIGLTLAALIAGWGVWWATARSVRTLQRALAASAPRRAAAGGLAALAILAFAVGQAVPDAYGAARPVDDIASRMVADQVGRLIPTLAMAGQFRTEEAADPLRGALPATPLAGLGGADVTVVFVESYGRSALEDPRFDTAPMAALAEAAPKLAAAGIHTASGWLASPTRGGQSWLAHATLASGLEVDNQLRYDLLVTGRRMTLVRLFADAGYHTALIAPAITRPLPEATRFYGFDHTLFADDLGYAGPPFGWVTMPDQYTLAAYERWRQRQPRPLFSEVVLVSSHAPWTPVPALVEDWGSIGDGSLYRTLPAAGGTPEEVWRDPDRIRTQYGLSVAYSLRAVLDYAGRLLDDHTLMIVLGDHQPAPIVTGPGTPRDVPVHVFSRDPDLVARFRDWGFANGLAPPAAGPVAPMASFRDAFARSFSP